MKQKILQSNFIRWISGRKISKTLSSHPFFGKIFNYEFISYVIAGVLTTVVSWLSFWLAIKVMPTVPANAVSFIAAVLFAYFANKLFVFDSPSFAPSVLVREFFPFVACRVLSFLFETAFLWLMCDRLGLNQMWMKILASTVVVIANYFTGKFLVFTKPREGSDHE